MVRTHIFPGRNVKMSQIYNKKFIAFDGSKQIPLVFDADYTNVTQSCNGASVHYIFDRNGNIIETRWGYGWERI